MFMISHQSQPFISFEDFFIMHKKYSRTNLYLSRMTHSTGWKQDRLRGTERGLRKGRAAIGSLI